MLREKFGKFKAFIDDFEIIPPKSRKIVIAMSGGKDGGVLAHFLLEYRKKVRPDLELEIISAPIPYWEQNPSALFDRPLDERQKMILERQSKRVSDFYAYWSSLMPCVTIPVQEDLYRERILAMSWPCLMCYCAKTKALHRYFVEKSFEDHTLFAYGWTKWDGHYTLLSHFLKSTGLKWREEKETNERKYNADRVFLASFSAYPKINIGIPGKKIFRINPMLDFDDNETGEIAGQIGFPIIPDICKELFGDVFDQDRRYLSTYLSLYSGNQRRLAAHDGAFMYSYRSLLRYMQKTEILPPAEELDGILYKGYDSDFSELYDRLRHQDDVLK